MGDSHPHRRDPQDHGPVGHSPNRIHDNHTRHNHTHDEHDHSHGWGDLLRHQHVPKATGKILIWSLIVTILFVAAEAAAGWVSNSLALLSDAGHNFTDAFGLVLAAFAFALEAKPGDRSKTFGYQRSGVLAAFVNALLLVGFSAYLLWESYLHLIHPEPVQEMMMLVVAAAGIVVNLGIAWGLGGHGHDLNIRAAFLHQIGDALSCVAIIVGALVIRYTGWLEIDPILSILIAIIIIWTAWDIFRDSLNILLEGLPKGLDLETVTEAMLQVHGAEEVHDLHIWSLGSKDHALSCHVVIADMPPSESKSILNALNQMMEERFGISHTTIQFEHRRCEVGDSCSDGSSVELQARHSH